MGVLVTRSVLTQKDLTGVVGSFVPPAMTLPGDVLIEYRVVLTMWTDFAVMPVGEGEPPIIVTEGPGYSLGSFGATVAGNGQVNFFADGSITVNGQPYVGYDDFCALIPQLQNQYVVRARLVREISRNGQDFTELLYLTNNKWQRVTSIRLNPIDVPPGGGGGQNGGM
jgi:hypothetical protein